MLFMKDNILIRIKCLNCKYNYFKRKNKSNIFCSKDCRSSYNIKYYNLKKPKLL